jgi:mono/diheme cytochrome c family protein
MRGFVTPGAHSYELDIEEVCVQTRIVLALMLAGMLVACASPSPTTAPANSKGDVAKGKLKYTSSCFSCHGTEGKGITGLTPSLQTSQFVKAQNDDQLVAFIKKGRAQNDPANASKIEMPAKGGDSSLNDAELYDIVAYLRAVQK